MIEPRPHFPVYERWHLTDDQVDAYALALLSPEECAPVEEHLLYCEPCQDALILMDDFIESLRTVPDLLGSSRTRLPSG